MKYNMQFDEEIINDFIDESKEYLTSVEESLLVLESQKNAPDFEFLDRIFRAIHTIKGGSGFLNSHRITELAHAMESLLDKMRENEIQPESHYIDTLLKSTDTLRHMIDDFHNSNTYEIQHLIEKLSQSSQSNQTEITVVSENSDELNTQSSQDEISVLTNEISSSSSQHKEELPVDSQEDSLKLDDIKQKKEVNHYYNIHFDLKSLYENENISPVDLIRDLKSMGNIVDAQLKTSAKSLDENLKNAQLNMSIVYETALEKNVISMMFMVPDNSISVYQGKLSKSFQSKITENKQTTIKNSQQLSPKVPSKKEITRQEKQIVETKAVSQPLENIEKDLTDKSEKKRLADNPKKKSSTDKNEKLALQESSSIRISVDILDRLMSLASELVLVRNRLLIQSSNSSQIIEDIAQELDVVTSEMQETVMLTRMQPLGNALTKMPRIVRDLARRFQKNIDIHISGNDVELDKNILEALSSPLLHIIRNACDHGIEMPEVRSKNGKSETGLIVVKGYHQAGLIHIDISDDGKGLDPSIIRSKALERGIASKNDLDQLSDKDVFSLIMTPGFSTAYEMSDISGRGVGMDVVKTAISQVGGVVEIDSVTGKGMQILMSLPLTLAIIPCLIVISNNERYAIPQVNMDEMVRLYQGTDYFIERSGDQEIYRLRNQLLPIVRLNELFKRSSRFTGKDRCEITDAYHEYRESAQSVLFAVVKTGSRRFGLIIDHMTGTEEIVVNPLPNALKNLQIYQGTTIMGDGEVAMVLDIDGIARHVGVEFSQNLEQNNLLSKRMSKSNIQRILTFQHGPKEQFAIPLILVQRLLQIHHNQIEKVGVDDDREFVVIDEHPVFIVRLDRMIPVSSPGLAQDRYYLFLGRYSGTPFGVLFTRLVGVMEMPDEIQEENYNMDCIFGCTIVKERLTLLLDLYELMRKGEEKWFSKHRQPAYAEQKKAQILLVEDTIFFTQLIRNFLESSGYQVFTAENGMHALSVLEKQSVDLIVSDIEMPVMDGWNFIQTVRKNNQYKNIPAMALTALTSSACMEKSKQMGFDTHEVKIDKDRMLLGVKDLLEKSKTRMLE